MSRGSQYNFYADFETTLIFWFSIAVTQFHNSTEKDARDLVAVPLIAFSNDVSSLVC